MSFLTERFFQVLDQHRIYSQVNTTSKLRHFMERHIICVWGYHELMKSLHQDIVKSSQPLNTEPFKEVLRLINEMVLEEQVDDMGDGRIISHLELYMEVMEELGCDMGPIFHFFDLIESGVKPHLAIASCGFPEEVLEMGEHLIQTLRRPMHVRATVLFYEGEPFIPDLFLSRLERFLDKKVAAKLMTYWERHIEGIKHPGFSAAGRLVEVLCMEDGDLSGEAEVAAEQAMARRIDFWNRVSSGLEAISEPAASLPIKPQAHLYLVR